MVYLFTILSLPRAWVSFYTSLPSELEFANQDGNSRYLEGDVMVKEVECAALVQAEPEEIKFKKWTKAGHIKPLYIKVHVTGKPDVIP